MKQLGSTDLKRLHREWRRKSTSRLALGLDSVQGPFNVGGILRTAAAYRAETVWLTARGTGPENPKVGKTALGSERFFDIERVPDGPAIISAAQAAGYRTIAIELADMSTPIFDADLTGDVCFVLGNEDHGMSAAALQVCDAAVYIPQLGKIGSLNVSIAAAVACYEWSRQQWRSDADAALTPDPRTT